MYSRLYKFFNDNQLIYQLQFGFRQNYSTSHALINLTEEIRNNLDKGNVGCGIFVDLQKAFDTVDHEILLSKLNHYGIRGITNSWFKSYLSDRSQFVSINGFSSKCMHIKHGVPQGSVLGPLLFLIYINDLNHAIKHCKVHHFADDTNLLHFNKSVNKLNKLVNTDMKNLANWLNSNKISLNVQKTELVIFKNKRKILENPIKITLSGKRLYPTNNVRYLGIKIDENLTWKEHIEYISTKLNRANALLYKIRTFVKSKTLRTIYFAIFESHLNYANLVWGQNCSSTQRIFTLQKKAIRIISFQNRNSHSSPFFKENMILKFHDKIKIDNIVFINKSLNNSLPSVFFNWFKFCSDIHNYETSSSANDHLFKQSYRTNAYGKYSLKISAIDSWNEIQDQMGMITLKDLNSKELKELLNKKFIDSY